MVSYPPPSFPIYYYWGCRRKCLKILVELCRYRRRNSSTGNAGVAGWRNSPLDSIHESKHPSIQHSSPSESPAVLDSIPFNSIGLNTFPFIILFWLVDFNLFLIQSTGNRSQLRRWNPQLLWKLQAAKGRIQGSNIHHLQTKWQQYTNRHWQSWRSRPTVRRLCSNPPRERLQIRSRRC